MQAPSRLAKINQPGLARRASKEWEEDRLRRNAAKLSCIRCHFSIPLQAGQKRSENLSVSMSISA